MHLSFKSRLITFVLASSLVAGLSACGGAEEEEGSAEVTVALSNLAVFSQNVRQSPWNFNPASVLAGTSLLGTPAAAPTGFSIRIKSITLVEDQDCGDCTIPIGDNIGEVGFLWTNPDCPKGSDDADCEDISYFDLNRASAAVNTELNAQAASITPGTYKYVKFGLLGEQSGANNTYNNTRWSYAPGEVTDKQFASIQTEWAAAFAEPLEVADGDQVTLTVSYDLDSIVEANATSEEKVAGNGIYQPGAADDCDTVSSVKTCIFFPTISVTAATQ